MISTFTMLALIGSLCLLFLAIAGAYWLAYGFTWCVFASLSYLTRIRFHGN
jgi:ABC-type multidrug transport system permease subunit